MKDTAIEDAVFLHYANPFLESVESLQEIDFQEVNWSYLLKRGKENKVLLPLVRNLIRAPAGIPASVIEHAHVLLDDGEKAFKQWLRNLNLLLNVFEDRSNQIDVLLIKSLRGYPHSSVDFDFLLRNKEDIQKAKQALKRVGYTFYATDDANKVGGKGDLISSSIEVDLYSRISWRNLQLTFLDHDGIWNRRKASKSYGFEIPTPSVEDDVLLYCAHSVFGHHRYFLGDLFYLVTVFKERVDFQYIFDTARKFGWSLALYYFLCYSDFLYQRYYEKAIIQRETLDSILGKGKATRLIDNVLQRQKRVPRFPCRYPLIFELLLTMEKATSNLNTQNISNMYKATSSLAIDEVHVLMSTIYDFLAL